MKTQANYAHTSLSGRRSTVNCNLRTCLEKSVCQTVQLFYQEFQGECLMLHVQYIFACGVLISSRVDSTSCRLCSIVLGKLPTEVSFDYFLFNCESNLLINKSIAFPPEQMGRRTSRRGLYTNEQYGRPLHLKTHKCTERMICVSNT